MSRVSRVSRVSLADDLAGTINSIAAGGHRAFIAGLSGIQFGAFAAAKRYWRGHFDRCAAMKNVRGTPVKSDRGKAPPSWKRAETERHGFNSTKRPGNPGNTHAPHTNRMEISNGSKPRRHRCLERCQPGDRPHAGGWGGLLQGRGRPARYFKFNSCPWPSGVSCRAVWHQIGGIRGSKTPSPMAMR